MVLVARDLSTHIGCKPMPRCATRLQLVENRILIASPTYAGQWRRAKLAHQQCRQRLDSPLGAGT